MTAMSMSALLFFLMCPRLALGHECGSGGRVRCMRVEHAAETPTHEQGRSARGTAFCTSSGAKVYCLANHDYHRCAAGREPCCEDGSPPLHGGRGYVASSTDAATCAPLDAGEGQEEDDVGAEGVGTEEVKEPRPAEVESVLTLTARLGEGAGVDLKLVLEEHQEVIQQTLQAHFGLEALRIVYISSGVAHRRLQRDTPDPFWIRIRFFAIGAAAPRSDRELARGLQSALSNAGAQVLVENVAVAWGAAQAFKTIESDEISCGLVIGIVAAVLVALVGLLLLCSAGYYVCKKRTQQKDVNVHQEEQAKGVPADQEEKKAEELEAASTSTQSPSDGASDGTSSLGEFEGTLHPVVVNKESSSMPPQGRDEESIGV